MVLSPFVNVVKSASCGPPCAIPPIAREEEAACVHVDNIGVLGHGETFASRQLSEKTKSFRKESLLTHDGVFLTRNANALGAELNLEPQRAIPCHDFASGEYVAIRYPVVSGKYL